MEKKLRKIIWALDAFEKPGQLQRNCIHTLERLIQHGMGLGKGKVEIEPVFVLQEQMAGPSLEFSPVWMAQYRSAAESALDKMMHAIRLPGLKPATLIPHPSTSTNAAATSLIQYAVKNKADLIVTNTHSKSGIKRMFLGSFAEALVMRSPIPVLSVGPHIRRLPKLNSVLFPTEFGAQSFKTFKKVVIQARRMKMGIVLYHAIPYPVRPYLSANVMYPSTYWNMLQDYLQRERARTKRLIHTWSTWAKAHGVTVKSVTDEKGGSLWEGIVWAADKNKVGLIALEAQSGPMSAALAGSTARQTIRNANCPVWVLGSRYARAHLRLVSEGEKKAA